MSDCFIDIHCHILPGIDDGPAALDESLKMAKIAARDGIETIVATPHQLGSFTANDPDEIRRRVEELQRLVDECGIPVEILPGADVRIEPDLRRKIRDDQVLTIGDSKRYVLLELPHEIYFPLEPILRELAAIDVVGVLTHPERNQGILRNPGLVEELVDAGCLMQVTASAVVGGFGEESRRLAQNLIRESLVHFIATDAHGVNARRPLMRRAFDHVVRLGGESMARRICTEFPGMAVDGDDIPPGRVRKRAWSILSWPSKRRAG